MPQNIHPHDYRISAQDRQKANNHDSFLIWFTGLSGSGKSTIANGLERELHAMQIKTFVLDGDNVRNGLNKDLSFSPEDRSENIRRIGEVAKLLIDAGLVVLAAFVSPYKKDRESVKNIVKGINFVEVYVNASIETCEKRDVKGLYKKARAGEILNMTGISAPYEAPAEPDIEIITDDLSVSEAVEQIMTIIKPKLSLRNE